MATKRDSDRAEVVHGPVVFMAPLPPIKRYRAKLDTAADLMREMRRLYREARSGLIDTQDATRCAYLLVSLGKLHEVHDREQRLTALENEHP